MRRSRIRRRSVTRPASLALLCSLPRQLRSSTRHPARNLLPPWRFTSTSARTVHPFLRRAPDRFAASARLEPGREEGNSTGGFYEIPIDDRGGYRTGRHSERNLAFG